MSFSPSISLSEDRGSFSTEGRMFTDSGKAATSTMLKFQSNKLFGRGETVISKVKLTLWSQLNPVISSVVELYSV